MKKSSRDKYLGSPTWVEPCLTDLTVDVGKRPRNLTTSTTRDSAKAGAEGEGFSGPLNANLAQQEVLFPMKMSDVRHNYWLHMSQKQRNCD